MKNSPSKLIRQNKQLKEQIQQLNFILWAFENLIFTKKEFEEYLNLIPERLEQIKNLKPIKPVFEEEK